MADLYTDADLETAAGFRYSAVPGEFDTLSAVDPDAAARVREATRRILDAVAPAIAARALRAAVDEYTTLIPDALGYEVQAVFTEDLLEAATEAERGFGK